MTFSKIFNFAFQRIYKMRLSLFALFFILHEGASLFFILQEKDYRCFFEDYQEDVVVKVQFNATVHQTSSHIGLFVTVVDPHRHLLLRKEYASKSTISFRTSESGEYQLCANLDSKKYAKGTDTNNAVWQASIVLR